jgi:hypothetical protein
MRRKGRRPRSAVTVLREAETEEDGTSGPIQHANAAVSVTGKWHDLLPMYMFANLHLLVSLSRSFVNHLTVPQ